MFSIRVMQMLAVLAFVTFMGMSASAQTYQSPAQATSTISTALLSLSKPALPSANGQVQAAHDNSFSAKVTPEATLRNLKIMYLKEVLLRLKQGSTTGAAIEDTYSMLNANLNGRPVSLIDQTRQYVSDLLDQ